MEKTQVASSQEVLDLLQQQHQQCNTTLALYNSLIDRIIINQELFLIHIEDQMVNRGVGIFDTFNYSEGKVKLFEQHFDRFQKSAELAQIPLPMNINYLKKKSLDTLIYTIEKFNLPLIHVRLYLTSGVGGGYGLGKRKNPVFYCAITKKLPVSTNQQQQGVHELTIPEIPSKPNLLANCKTTNYLLNCLTFQKAHQIDDANSYLGVNVDSEGYITEASVSNVAFVFNGNELITTPFDCILQGTTITMIIEKVQQHLQSQNSLEIIPVKKFSFRRVKPAEVYVQASEMLIIGGDKCTPVVNLDGRQIGNGSVGPVAKWIQSILNSPDYGESLNLIVERTNKVIQQLNLSKDKQ